MSDTRRPREDDGLRRVVGRIVEMRAVVIRVSPTVIATEAMALIDPEQVSPLLVRLGCHLQLRQISRELLRTHFSPAAERHRRENPSLFPELQERYPTAKSANSDEPEYILRDYMTEEDVRYNVARLRSEAEAKLKHADALEAWWDNRPFELTA